ncbi:MAG: hypothetical protein ABH842_04215 [Candidatus Micrarchaeota archaeon]
MVLIMLVISLRNGQLSTERTLLEPLPLTYGAFLLDDIAYELNSIIGPQLYIDQKNTSTELTIADTLESQNFSSQISAYEAFLVSEVAIQTASTINTNFTNLTNGTIRIFINEEYVYTNDHATNETLFTKDGGTDATSYEINFTITAVRENVTHMAFDENGTLNVTITYTDLNGTEVEEGKVFPNQVNTFKVEYVGGSAMTIKVGQQSSNFGSLYMNSEDIRAETSWKVTLPPIDPATKKGYEYDATIDYTQGPFSITRRIGK